MFKNVRLYRLAEPFTLGQEGLDSQLAERRFRPCGPLESATLGWHPPIGGEGAALVHGAGDCLLFAARRQERLLPASVVAEVVAERVAEIEANEARTPGSKEKRQLREDALAEMLPRAFTRSRLIRGYIDTKAGWVVLDAGSDKAAEEVLSLLRETLGSLRATPPEAAKPPADLMTLWLQSGQLPAGFELEDQCELRDAADTKSVVRCRGQDLTGEEVATHLEAGKQVVKLALDWREHLTFVLDEDLGLKRLKMAESLIDEEIGDGIEDDLARLDAEFALLALQLRELIARLVEIFGLGGDGSDSGRNALVQMGEKA